MKDEDINITMARQGLTWTLEELVKLRRTAEPTMAFQVGFMNAVLQSVGARLGVDEKLLQDLNATLNLSTAV